jgi:hypothetical protein
VQATIAQTSRPAVTKQKTILRGDVSIMIISPPEWLLVRYTRAAHRDNPMEM